tara:strand:+ start:591 stop:1820 length:1230 start_codon:yes stop_codon:yes gene_type:complete
MALVVYDRVKETTAVVGTGTATLLGATIGFQSFAVVGNGNTTYYCIADQGGANWEVGLGTYTLSGTTLARTTVLSSSNAGALVSFTSGTKDVFVTYPSARFVQQDQSRIINGGMDIDQRNAGAEVNPAASGVYYLDRWLVGSTIASKFKIGQNAGAVTPPVGFSKYLGCTSLSAYTVGASESFNIQQRIEGFNTSDLGWGTASASTVTLSFQVYSSLTGTFGGALRNSASTRSYPFSYSISVANTWTTISITIAGEGSGVWVGATNGIGLNLTFSLGTGATVSGTAGAWAAAAYASATGAVSVVGTSGATLYITGVQLEKGSVATSFDYRPYGTELILCQRYYQIVSVRVPTIAEGAALASYILPVRPRATPTISGGGAGFAATISPTGTYVQSQTTAAFNDLEFSAEL